MCTCTNETIPQSLVKNMDPWETVAIKLVKSLDESGDPIHTLVVRKEEPEKYRQIPTAAKEIKLKTVKSFCEYVELNGDPAVADIYISKSYYLQDGEEDARQVAKCVFNPKAPLAPAGDLDTCWLITSYHSNFIEWLKATDKRYTLKGFLDFLRKNIDDVFPDQADFLLSGYSKVSTAVKMQRDYSLDDRCGLYQGVSYTSKTGTTDPSKLLTKFAIQVPIFNDPMFSDPVDFTISVDIDEPDNPQKEAVFSIRSRTLESMFNHDAGKIIADAIRAQLPDFHIFE
jgi:hypothetical protein